jgi:RNA polymerase sigma-70 factor (ECF subfamily)
MPPDGVEHDSDERLLADQRIERLHAAIARLPVEYREALVLCELHELSYAETAAVLGCPIGTIRSRLHRARALLTAMLDEGERSPTVDTKVAGSLQTGEVCS